MRYRTHLTLHIGMVLVLAVWWHPASGQESSSTARAGLISDLAGSVSIRKAGAAKAAAAGRFDAINVGATVQVGPKSTALIVLPGGQRFELGAGAQATLEMDRLTSRYGPIKELASLPPLPRLFALDASRPTGPAAAIRIRGTTISGLQPSDHATLAARTRLRFAPVPTASRYIVEIQNEAGQPVFAAETTTSDITVPPDALQQGTTYYWTVRTLDQFGPTATGAGTFRTLSADQEREREALRQALEAEGGGRALALQAAVDRRLDLFQEAVDGFRAALAESPNDTEIQRALRQLEAGAKR